MKPQLERPGERGNDKWEGCGRGMLLFRPEGPAASLSRRGAAWGQGGAVLGHFSPHPRMDGQGMMEPNGSLQTREAYISPTSQAHWMWPLPEWVLSCQRIGVCFTGKRYWPHLQRSQCLRMSPWETSAHVTGQSSKGKVSTDCRWIFTMWNYKINSQCQPVYSSLASYFVRAANGE